MTASGGDRDWGGGGASGMLVMFCFYSGAGSLSGNSHFSSCIFLNAHIIQKKILKITLNSKNNGYPLLFTQHFIIYKGFSHVVPYASLSHSFIHQSVAYLLCARSVLGDASNIRAAKA